MILSADVISWLKLQPNVAEGGFFAPVYESHLHIADGSLPGFAITDQNGRPLCGAIYYFIDETGGSVLHKVTGDMVYHFYNGDPVQMLLLYPQGSLNQAEVCIFSNDLAAGGTPMKVIPGGTWLGSRLVPGGNYALMGVTMAPGFNPVDYSIGNKAQLSAQYPQMADIITLFTKQ